MFSVKGLSGWRVTRPLRHFGRFVEKISLRVNFVALKHFFLRNRWAERCRGEQTARKISSEKGFCVKYASELSLIWNSFHRRNSTPRFSANLLFTKPTRRGNSFIHFACRLRLAGEIFINQTLISLCDLREGVNSQRNSFLNAIHALIVNFAKSDLWVCQCWSESLWSQSQLQHKRSQHFSQIFSSWIIFFNDNTKNCALQCLAS